LDQAVVVAKPTYAPPPAVQRNYMAWKSTITTQQPAQHQQSSPARKDVVTIVRRRNSSPKLKGSFLPSLSYDKLSHGSKTTNDLDPLLKIKVCICYNNTFGNNLLLGYELISWKISSYINIYITTE
jgi:hypothetical protein